MDGKTTNGSSRSKESSEKIKPVNTMSVYSTNYGISLIQDFIDKVVLNFMTDKSKIVV